MLRSMYSAISGMKSQQTKLDVIANNIANVGTTAFKASTVNFADTLYQSTAQAAAPTTNIGGTNAKSVGLGSQVSSIDKLMTTGNALTTGRTLDVCVDGDGYLVTTKGTIDGSLPVASNAFGAPSSTGSIAEKVYTRDGNLSLDQNGNLVTSNGNRVMGYWPASSQATLTADPTKQTITVTGAYNTDTAAAYDTTSLKPLAIPSSITPNGASTAEAVSGFSIGSDGVITVVTSSGKYAIGQIAMANFKNPEGLQDLGSDYQQETGNSGSAIISDAASVTTNSNSGAYGSIKSGYLEASNVDLTQQFTDMISATRSFEAASKMITNGDEILQTITGLIR
ncbi:flagellar hook-basal body complex protein [Clostridium sp.]|uniref:flagellar hook-basal body complex protein n=1 Tax=Clostridium sp. TaxID=1506 RepID=UPI002844840C|nr:flagellar hook-basal body complex protein [Clostridium sp.]MDR3594011.1 flagellar hook-basal body complex protein [Clostridium sp.]